MNYFSIFNIKKYFSKTHPLHNVKFFPDPGAIIRADIFENRNVGIKRNLFWSLTIPQMPFEYFGELRQTSISFDFLALHEGTDRFRFSHKKSKFVECTWYLFQHHCAKSWELDLKIANDYSSFDVSYKCIFDFDGFDRDPCDDLVISGNTKLSFEGIFVGRDNTFPKPNSEADAREVIRPFFRDIASFECKSVDYSDGEISKPPSVYCFNASLDK